MASTTDYKLAEDSSIEKKVEISNNEEQCPSNWSSKKLAHHIAESGLGDYSEMIMQHKITGKLALILGDQDLKDMGVTVIGDRLRLKEALGSLKSKSKYSLNSRSHVLWEGVEKRYYNDSEKDFATCFGIMPDDPGTYKLTGTHLKIKTVHPLRFGPAHLRCWFEYGLQNVDLTQIADIDVMTTAAPCPQRVFCCARGRDVIDIKTNASPRKRVILLVNEGEGDYVSNMIMTQAEEASHMDRS